MTDPAARDRHPSHSVLHCTTCGANLSHDQRYCVECGTRRGPLPHKVSELIAGILERGKSPVAIPAGPARRLLPLPVNWMPSTQTVALAVMGMLAFGVAIGDAASTGVGGIGGGRSPLIVFRESPPPATPPANTTASTGGGSSGSGSSNSTSTTTATTTTPTTTTTPANNNGSSNPFGLPPIKHVFLVVLSGQGYSQSFGSTNKYFSKTLPKQGELIQQYFGVATGELANGIGLISGQGPTPETDMNCPMYKKMVPGTKGSQGQVLGTGCVYPAQTETIATQLTAKHDTWKAYLQGLDTKVHGQAGACRRPALGAADSEQAPTAKDPYVTWQNPFVYFESDLKGSACKHDDVGLKQLASDLKSTSTTPNFSYIAPDPCDDGADQPCTANAKSGLDPAEKFLKTVVPEIENSPAYKADGLLIITFDQAAQTGPHADSTSCCVTATFPNLPPPASTTTPTTTPATTTAPTTTAPATTTTTAAPTTTTTTTPNILAPVLKLLGLTTTTTTTTAPPPPTTGTTTTTTTVTTTAPPPSCPTTTTPATTTTSTTTTSTTTTPPPSCTTTTTTTTAPGASGGTEPGGGQVGLLLISQYVKKGTTDLSDQYDHFALLASIEKLFGLKLLGYGNFSGLLTFDATIYNGFTAG